MFKCKQHLKAMRCDALQAKSDVAESCVTNVTPVSTELQQAPACLLHMQVCNASRPLHCRTQ